MESKELRIGNYVIDPYNKVIRLVNVDADASMLGRIELTEGWLLKFGFKEDDSLLDPPDTPNGNFWVDYVKGDIIIQMPFFEFYCNDLPIEIKYVHQLQNLYFALTGEELVIK